MRIIGGEYKGVPLKSLDGDNTRPTSDKVKESVFNRLGQYFDGETVLDLFAGTGSLGLEAISRGCKQAVFVDNNYKAIKIIKENIEKVKAQYCTDVIKADAFKAINNFGANEQKFDIIFLDPPYHNTDYLKLLQLICEANIINDESLIVVEYHHEYNLQWPNKLVELSYKKYGTICVSILQINQ